MERERERDQQHRKNPLAESLILTCRFIKSRKKVIMLIRIKIQRGKRIYLLYFSMNMQVHISKNGGSTIYTSTTEGIYTDIY